MYEVFHGADQDIALFDRNKDYDSIENAIRELGSETLQENADWLAVHRERKLSAKHMFG